MAQYALPVRLRSRISSNEIGMHTRYVYMRDIRSHAYTKHLPFILFSNKNIIFRIPMSQIEFMMPIVLQSNNLLSH